MFVLAPFFFVRRKVKVKKFLSITLLLVVALVISGCGGDSDAKANKERSSASSPGSPKISDKVIVSVDGGVLRQSEIDRMVALTQKLASMRKRKMAKGELDRIGKKAALEAMPFFVQKRLYSRYLQAHGLSVSSNSIALYQKRMAKSFRVKNIEALKKKLSKDESELLDVINVGRLTIMEAKKHIVAKAGIKVSAEEIDKVINGIKRANELAMATNRLVYAHATNVWEQIKSRKITFEEAVSDFSEEEVLSEGGEWGMFSKDMLKDEVPLMKILENAKAGDITPPIESDNGLAIIRISSLPTDEDANYHIARIFFRLPRMYEEPSRSEVEQGLKKRGEEKAVSDKFKELVKAARIIDNTKKGSGKPDPGKK